MKIKRVNSKRIKIEHNSKLFLVIIALIIVLMITIFYIFNINKENKIQDYLKCERDSDCVPNRCCHPDSCININNAPDCKEILCTMACIGPIDCGAGSCGCINNKCGIIENKGKID